jgi:hypothetical protein
MEVHALCLGNIETGRRKKGLARLPQTKMRMSPCSIPVKFQEEFPFKLQSMGKCIHTVHAEVEQVSTKEASSSSQGWCSQRQQF